MCFLRRWMWQEVASPSLSRRWIWHPISFKKTWAWHPHLTIISYTKQEYSTVFSVCYNMFFHHTINYMGLSFMKVDVASPSLPRR